MKNDDAKIIIKEVLTKMDATNITFQEIKNNNSIVVMFDCKEVTSFVANISGWTYSGIQLDPTKEHQYRIEFIKIS